MPISSRVILRKRFNVIHDAVKDIHASQLVQHPLIGPKKIATVRTKSLYELYQTLSLGEWVWLARLQNRLQNKTNSSFTSPFNNEKNG